MTFNNFINQNLVSIIVPLYNKETTIVKCIKSLLYQTYQNIEIIVVNDCSTYSSIEILNKFIQNNKFHPICNI